MKFKISALALALVFVTAVRAQSAAQLDLKQGDHIAIIGNTLADRFQHSGWLETYLYTRYPNYDLVVRNLAVAGDQVSLRHRSENFGTPDQWLTRAKADVIFAFFGFNESFQGAAGLPKFKADLTKFIEDARAKNYSGKGAPRIVLFSPIANEKLPDPNFPDPTGNNLNIHAYAEAIAEVARANGIPFVDLYEPSEKLYAEAAQNHQSLTIDGLHLSEEADKQIAAVIYKGLFGEDVPTATLEVPGGNFEKVRSAVNEKNAEWHSRYRTIDGYNVYGGRSALAYQPDKGGFISNREAPSPYISNYKVMQEEMSQRDVMTANRDKKVWAVAKGGDLVVDDSNVPPVEEVPTNERGANADGTFPFLGGEEAISKMTVHSGMKVNLFASEEMFPELVKPVQMNWDTKGRLWVAVWPNYPERTPLSKKGDSLIILEDTDGDGKADQCTHFVDDLNAPTGFQFYKDGVILMQAPDMWFLRDTDGDGKADWRQRILMGMDSADSHHTANSICLDPGGAVYLSDGVFHRTQVETMYGPVLNDDAAIYRFEPRTRKFERYVSYGFANPHGRVWDYWGNDIITDATGNNSYFAPAFSGHIDYPAKHPRMQEFWKRPSRPCAGTGIISSRHFPPELQGDFLNCNVISFQGIYMVKVEPDGSGLQGETQESLISSSDPNFRPVSVNDGPDGALYVLDWQNPIIGHMQHHLRDPNRDHDHGRIYRITYPGRPLLKTPKIAGQPIPALLELLKEPENQTRTLAKVELGAHEASEVIPAVNAWAAALDKKDPSYEHNMLEALWVHQWMNMVDMSLLTRMLQSPEPMARAAAGRVMCYWRDRVPDALAMFKKLANDESPRVRLEAVRAASFFQNGGAADVALEALKHPMDYYLEYTLKETMRQLDPWWHSAIAAGQAIARDNPAGADYLVRSVTTPELLRLPRTEMVLEAIVQRADAPDQDRLAALNDLSKARKTSHVAELLAAFGGKKKDEATVAGLARLLAWQPPAELKTERSRVAALIQPDSPPILREAARASLALADDSFDTVWNDAAKSPAALEELLGGIPLINDADFRAKAYDKVKPLLAESSPEVQALRSGKAGAVGRFVRIELPRQGTLTLAEVQVFSGGKNVAMGGKARQSSTAFDGVASRAIDGRTDPTFGSGTQTHTKEDENHPWWELDLGSEYPIDTITVWNRIEDLLGNRLKGFTLTVMDANRHTVFERADNAVPSPSLQISVGGDTLSSVRRAAIRAIVGMNHEPEAVFGLLADLINHSEQVASAARGMRVLPRAGWPKSQAGAAAKSLVAWARTIPSGDRTEQDYVETVQMAGDLAGFLPAAEAASLRNDLKQLRVAVFVIHTVREQMRYDTPRLVVEAGKAFEVIFENNDFMPHNFVVVNPGSREKVGVASGTMKPEELDDQGRAYIPKTPDVLAATKLVEPGGKEALKLTAPSTEEECEYVCTFPGHYQVMWGKLIVTKDVDGYLQAHPDAGMGAAMPAGHQHQHGNNGLE